MKTPRSVLSRVRLASFAVLCIVTLTQVGCSTAGSNSGGWLDSRRDDLQKIFVYAMSPAPNLQLPPMRGNAPQILTQALQQQLAEENLLETDEGEHALSFYGVVLSYQADFIEAQGELYDGERFLVHSRVKRRLAPGDDWHIGLNLVAEQMLDELMLKLYGKAEAPLCRTGDYGCTPMPPSPPIDDCAVAGCPDPDPYPIYIYFDNYCWGCWRYDDDYGHGGHGKPKPKPHWVSGAILESLPRSSTVSPVRDHGTRGGSSTGTSTTGSGGGTTGGTRSWPSPRTPDTRPGGTSTTPSGGDVHTDTESSTSLPPIREGGRRVEHAPRTGDESIRSAPVYEAPRSAPVVESAPTRSAPVYEAPRSAPVVESVPTRSAPVYEAPRSAPVVESVPTRSAPVYEAPRSAPVVESAPTRSAPVYEAPRSAPVVESAPTRSAPSSTSTSGSGSGSGSGGGSSGRGGRGSSDDSGSGGSSGGGGRGRR